MSTDLGSPQAGARALAANVCLRALYDGDEEFLSREGVGADLLLELGIPWRLIREAREHGAPEARRRVRGLRDRRRNSGPRMQWQASVLRRAAQMHAAGWTYRQIVDELHLPVCADALGDAVRYWRLRHPEEA